MSLTKDHLVIDIRLDFRYQILDIIDIRLDISLDISLDVRLDNRLDNRFVSDIRYKTGCGRPSCDLYTFVQKVQETQNLIQKVTVMTPNLL